MKQATACLLAGLSLVLVVSGCNTSPSADDNKVAIPIAAKILDSDQAIISMAFAPDGRIFYTELFSGNIRIIKDDVLLPTPFATLPVLASGEHGVLGIVLHPDFETNHWVYVFYTHKTDEEFGEAANRLVRLVANGDVWDGTETPIIDRLPAAIYHNGGNMAFGPKDGKLYVSYGEQFHDPATAQDVSLPQGSILRLNEDGTIPDDNPIPGNPIFAYGLRNSFDMAFDPVSKVLFATENGENSDDEINRILAGKNYGWPMVQGMAEPGPEQDFAKSINNYQDPILALTPVVAITGIDFAPNALFGKGAEGNLFYTEWLYGRIWRVKLNATRDAVEQRVEFYNNIPDAPVDLRFGPDGSMYVTTMSALWKLTPMPEEEIATAEE